MNCNGLVLDLSRPVVMGILNITPDSFYDGGNYTTSSAMLAQVEKMITDGASIIDIGAVSTRPGADDISEEEESKRLFPALELVRKTFPDIIISVDTYRSEVARKAVTLGANIINDVSGGNHDHNMFATVGKLNVPYILMHMQGNPQTMQDNPHYENVVAEVYSFFEEKIRELRQHGVEHIILDPGFGFGKTLEHNYQLLKHLREFKQLQCPILAGVSRKSMINKVLHTTPEHALNGTTALNTLALLNGADIIRVHDVKEAVETVSLTTFYSHIV